MACECEKEKFYLLLSATFTGAMWVLSEIIGSSKCKPNGVFEFIVHGFCFNIKINAHRVTPAQIDGTDAHDHETDLLIDQAPPEMVV